MLDAGRDSRRMFSIGARRDRKRYQAIITSGVIVALAILIIGIFNSYKNISTLVEASHGVAESHRTLAQLQQLSSLLNDASGASRGYLLTQRKEYHEAYNSARERLTPVFDSISQREEGEKENATEIDQLRKLTHVQLLLLDQLIRVRDEKGFQAANDLFQTAGSPQAAEEIGLVISRIQAREFRELQRNEGESAEIAYVTLRNILFAGLPAVIFLMAAGFMIRRDIARREIAERSVIEAESRFRALLQNSNDIVVAIDPDGIIEYISPAVESVLGYSRDEVVFSNVFEFVHPDDVGFSRESFRTTVQSPGPAEPLQLRLRKKSQSYVYVEIIANNLLDDKHIRSIIFNARDITFRKELFKRLQLSYAVTRVLGSSSSLEEASLQLLQSICDCGGYFLAELWDIREDERKIACTHVWKQPGVQEVLEPEGSEYELVDGVGLVGRVYQAKAMVSLENVGEDSLFVRRERALALGLRAAVGIPIQFEETVYAVACLYSRAAGALDDELAQMFKRIGQEIGAFIARKEAERTQRRLTEVLEATPDFVVISAPDNYVLYANGAARMKVGFQTGPHENYSIYHPAWAGAQLESVGRPLAIRDGYWSGESAVLDKQGNEVPVSQIIIAHRSRDGELEFLATVMRDISERKAVERMKDDFISMVSHELRTPLTSIRASLGLLASGQLAHDDALGKRMLELANVNTIRLVRLVNDILDIERLDAGRLVMQKRPAEAAQLLLSAASSMHPPCRLANILLTVRPSQGFVMADPDRILQMLTNLIGNAIKFSPEGSTICVSSSNEGDRTVFCVRDQGRGVPKHKQELIFERFQQVDASDSRLESGTGLGLAICRSIVRAHGGEIWVESEPGQGSNFKFFLPMATEEAMSNNLTMNTKEAADAARASD